MIMEETIIVINFDGIKNESAESSKKRENKYMIPRVCL